MKELVRNGGFERDSLDFWDVYLGTAEITSAVKHAGYHSAKLVTGSTNTVYLWTRDFIEVSPYELYRILTWIKSVSWTYIQGEIYYYDSDYQSLTEGNTSMFKELGSYDWKRKEFYFSVPTDASYMTIAYHAVGTEGSYGYLDSISVAQIDIQDVAAMHVTLVKEEDLTTAGTYYSDEFFVGMWERAIFGLNCTSLSGSSPTLDVSIEVYIPDVDIWIPVLSFNQLTSSGSEVKTLSEVHGWLLRIKYVLGGTVTDCDFKVGAVFKR